MHPSALKVADAAQALGLAIEIVEFEQTTRSAQEAAEAIGCEVAQIVKSLCFVVNGRSTICLVSGANQLDERKLAALAGVGRKQVKRADAETVKATTGFSIGGVPPFGHITAVSIYIDTDLMQYEVVWAAAGTPFAVFACAPTDLARVTQGQIVDIRKSESKS
jgi:Cys-tRNA(Pro) deacylase